MTTATLGGNALTKASLQIPAFGLWWADCELAEPAELSGGQVLSIGGSEFSCSVISGGPFDGKARYRLVAGAGGWLSQLPKKAYANDAEVKASTVIGDAAESAGEQTATLPTTRLGPHFVRPAGVAAASLNVIYPSGWHLDNSGTLQIGARAASTFSGESTEVRRDEAAGILELAVESVAGLLPGVTVGDFGPAVDVEIKLDSKRLSVVLYRGEGQSSRRLTAIKAIVEQLFPSIKYRGIYEYRVVSQETERLNLQAVRVSLGLPDLNRVPVRPGMAGLSADVALGSLVLVSFVNADPARPVVIGFGAPDDPGWSPTQIQLAGESEFIALATKVGTELSRVQSDLSTVQTYLSTHAHAGVTTGGGVTGPPAAPPPSPTSPGSVASAKVKAI